VAQVRNITISSDLYDGQVCFVNFLDSEGNTTNLGQQILSFTFTTESEGGTCFVYVPSVDNTFVVQIINNPCPTPTPTPDGFLLQENLFRIDQEDGFGISIT
jgi:hypothetical protein